MFVAAIAPDSRLAMRFADGSFIALRGGEAHNEPEKEWVQAKHVCKCWSIHLADAHRVCSRREKGWHEIGQAVHRLRTSEDN